MSEPDHVLEAEKSGMSFEECVIFCAGNQELVREFDRLYGTNLSQIGRRSGIERLVDEATGYTADSMRKWVAFVWECIWTRLPDEAFVDDIEVAK